MFTLDVCVCITINIQHCVNGNGNTNAQIGGLNPFLTLYIDAMLNVDANANITCAQTLSIVFM